MENTIVGSSTCPILALPIELQTKILSHVDSDLESYTTILEVCPLWKEIVFVAPSVVEKRYTSTLTVESHQTCVSKGLELHKILEHGGDGIFITADFRYGIVTNIMHTIRVSQQAIFGYDISDCAFLDEPMMRPISQNRNEEKELRFVIEAAFTPKPMANYTWSVAEYACPWDLSDLAIQLAHDPDALSYGYQALSLKEEHMPPKTFTIREFIHRLVTRLEIDARNGDIGQKCVCLDPEQTCIANHHVVLGGPSVGIRLRLKEVNDFDGFVFSVKVFKNEVVPVCVHRLCNGRKYNLPVGCAACDAWHNVTTKWVS